MVVADASLMCFPYNVYVSFDLGVRYAKCRSLLVLYLSLSSVLRSEMIKRLVEALKGTYATAHVNYVVLKAISDCCLSVNSKYLRRSAISIAWRYHERDIKRSFPFSLFEKIEQRIYFFETLSLKKIFPFDALLCFCSLMHCIACYVYC